VPGSETHCVRGTFACCVSPKSPLDTCIHEILGKLPLHPLHKRRALCPQSSHHTHPVALKHTRHSVHCPTPMLCLDALEWFLHYCSSNFHSMRARCERPLTPTSGATHRAATRGGATRGGATRRGATRGGATRGGATSGGATSGGATSGGASKGGATRGGATSGGATSAGATRGGATRGGGPPGWRSFRYSARRQHLPPRCGKHSWHRCGPP
jgi:hypothetical protein